MGFWLRSKRGPISAVRDGLGGPYRAVGTSEPVWFDNLDASAFGVGDDADLEIVVDLPRSDGAPASSTLTAPPREVVVRTSFAEVETKTSTAYAAAPSSGGPGKSPRRRRGRPAKAKGGPE